MNQLATIPASCPAPDRAPASTPVFVIGEASAAVPRAVPRTIAEVGAACGITAVLPQDRDWRSPVGGPDHAVALFRVDATSRIDRRVAGRALRAGASLATEPPGGSWMRIYFAADLLAAAEAAHGTRFESLTAITDGEVFSLAEMIHAAISQHAAPEPLLLQSLGHVLLWRLLLLAPALLPPDPAPARGGLAPWQIRRTAAFLAANIERRVALCELAAIARLSPFHFARAFARSMGMPPYRYQQKLRIERAAELLATSDMRIIEIALAVGYETPQALARVFVQQHGVTPSDWRRQHAQG